jgi:hypothetical protein
MTPDSRRGGVAQRGKRMRGYYCVMCGADEPYGLETCPQSESGLAHLHAAYGHVEPWFDHKKEVEP